MDRLASTPVMGCWLTGGSGDATGALATVVETADQFDHPVVVVGVDVVLLEHDEQGVRGDPGIPARKRPEVVGQPLQDRDLGWDAHASPPSRSRRAFACEVLKDSQDLPSFPAASQS